MSSIKKWKWRNWEIRKNPERKILRRKSKDNFIRKNGFHIKIKSFIKFLCVSSINDRTATRVLHHLASSFENKPLVTLDWSSKSRKRHRHSSSCGQSERIKGKIFFYKEYYFWDCSHNIFNKYFFTLFSYLFCLFCITKFTKFVCTNFFMDI